MKYKLQVLDVVCVRRIKDEEGNTFERKILSKVSFSIFEGEIFAIMGSSGTGKTTLLRFFNRLEDPTSGKILLDERDIREIDPIVLRKRVGFVSQIPYMFEGDVKENLLFGPKVTGGDVNKALNMIKEYLPWFGFKEEILFRDTSNLSVGEKQRLCILRALANEPEVLLLDEPTSALDPQSASSLLDLIKRINKSKKKTMVFVSHLPEHVERVAHRGVILMGGKVEAYGEISRIFHQCTNKKVVDFLSGNAKDESLRDEEIADV